MPFARLPAAFLPPLSVVVALLLATRLWSAPSAPSALDVLPPTILLDGPREGCQVIVTGRYSDGTQRDLTATADLRPAADLAVVEPDGYLRPRRDGETTLVVRAGGLEARVRL